MRQICENLNKQISADIWARSTDFGFASVLRTSFFSHSFRFDRSDFVFVIIIIYGVEALGRLCAKTMDNPMQFNDYD